MRDVIFAILSGLAAAVIHEGGHWLAALCFRRILRFQFSCARLWKIPIPRWTWTMPDIERWKQKVIALSGFGAEFLAVPIFYALWPELAFRYAIAAAAHFAAYPFYAGKETDLKWLV